MRVSLKAARVNANLSQKDVANALKISKSTIINWEKGKTSPNVLQMQKLCEIYHAPLNDIFFAN